MKKLLRIWVAVPMVALATVATIQLSARAEDREQERLPTPEGAWRGWRLFFSKSCIRCHSIWSKGGQIGPDLGRGSTGQLSEGGLAASLWSHVPRMWTEMEEEEIAFEPISKTEMEDLFAFFFFLRYLGKSGDPDRGRTAFIRHGCQSCHQISGEGGSVGPDLARWSRFTNPVVWAQMMWEAAPAMQAALRKKSMQWPKLESDDMRNMVAYIRSVSPSREKVFLTPGSPPEGQKLLASKGCNSCHQPEGNRRAVGPDLSRISIPNNMAEVAQRMWNHAPEMFRAMRRRGVKVEPLSAQEMAHIASFLLTYHYKDRPGDPESGRSIFIKKRCHVCHEKGTRLAPALQTMHAEGTVPYIAHVMWNQGRAMLDEMIHAGIPWPIFTREEMLDLLAYLKQHR